MQVLLTSVGFHDPNFPSRVDGEELKGTAFGRILGSPWEK